ncbi:unnamed protein product, partial [Laminaria digitata]
GLEPLTPREKSMASERCQGPPGAGPSEEWTVFDTAKLEASQRALAHAVDLLRCRAASAAAEAAMAASAAAEASAAGRGFEAGLELRGPARRRLAMSPEGLCVALRACVDNSRGAAAAAGAAVAAGGG